MKTLLFIMVVFIAASCSLFEDNSSDYKDFEICIVGTDHAKIEVYKQYGDSSLIISDIFDSQEIQSLHYSNINSGKYLITAVCNYPVIKEDTVRKKVTYNGRSASYTLYFEDK